MIIWFVLGTIVALHLEKMEQQKLLTPLKDFSALGWRAEPLMALERCSYHRGVCHQQPLEFGLPWLMKLRIAWEWVESNQWPLIPYLHCCPWCYCIRMIQSLLYECIVQHHVVVQLKFPLSQLVVVAVRQVAKPLNRQTGSCWREFHDNNTHISLLTPKMALNRGWNWTHVDIMTHLMLVDQKICHVEPLKAPRPGRVCVPDTRPPHGSSEPQWTCPMVVAVLALGVPMIDAYSDVLRRVHTSM